MTVRTCGLILSIAFAATSGCTVESKSSPFIPVSGQVTYLGVPVKKGGIHLIPIDPKGTTASGEIVEGALRNVTSHTQGDGAKLGKYRVSITVFDDAYLEEKGKMDSAGPTAAGIAELVSGVKKTIPLRYSNIGSSGLTAEIKSGVNDLRYDLKSE